MSTKTLLLSFIFSRKEWLAILKLVNLNAYCKSRTYQILRWNVSGWLHYRSHSKVSGVISSLGGHRFEHQVSYNWSLGKWGDGRRTWSIMWRFTSFWKEASNSLLIKKLNEFHMCDTTFSSMSGRPLEKFYSKVTLMQDTFRLFLAKLLFCIIWRSWRGWPVIIAFFYLSNDEANMKKGLGSGIDDFSIDALYEFFEQFKVRSLVTKSNIKK